MNKKIILACVSYLVLTIGLIVWVSYSSNHINDGCVEKKCEYTDDIGMGQEHGCVVNVVNDSAFGCEYLFRSCPKDKNTPCYIYKKYYCPLIGSCYNPEYNIQLLMGGIFLILLFISSAVGLIFGVAHLCNRQ